jgi:GNAT superfamily N-acetyltransferase
MVGFCLAKSKSTMRVRLALPADEDQFVALAEQAHAESRPHIPYAEEKVRLTFANYLATAHPTITVVEDKGEIVAFMKQTISEYDSGYGLFTTQEVLFVRPDKRGTRAAALLLRWFTDWSDNTIGAVESTGGNDNALTSDRTRRFLRKHGFEEVGFFMRRVRSAGDGKEGRD